MFGGAPCPYFGFTDAAESLRLPQLVAAPDRASEDLLQMDRSFYRFSYRGSHDQGTLVSDFQVS